MQLAIVVPRPLAPTPLSAAAARLMETGEPIHALRDIQDQIRQVHVVPEHGAALVRHARSLVVALSRFAPIPPPAAAAHLVEIHETIRAFQDIQGQIHNAHAVRILGMDFVRRAQ